MCVCDVLAAVGSIGGNRGRRVNSFLIGLSAAQGLSNQELMGPIAIGTGVSEA